MGHVIAAAVKATFHCIFHKTSLLIINKHEEQQACVPFSHVHIVYGKSGKAANVK